MTKKEDQSIAVAGRMARSWSDEVLASKTPDDLVKAFGVTERSAEAILKNERYYRGIK